MKKAYWLFALFILAAACGDPGDPSFGKNDIDRIRHTMQEYREAWMSGDTAAVLHAISDDMILYMPGESGTPVTGKDSVAAFWFPPSDLSYPITRYRVTHEKIEGSGNLALYSGISTLTWHVLKGNVHSDTTTSVTEFLNILRKEQDKWKLYRVMYNVKDEGYIR